MRPDDRNGHRPPAERPFRVLVIAGSNRRQYDCPGIDSKARALMLRMGDRLPMTWEVDREDLGNVHRRSRIQSCNGCVSTSMALCVWPCNCYERGDRRQPDLMWDLDLYARLDLADAWAIIAPVNWFGPTSNLKLMFDRLVCMNGGNPREELIAHKDPELAMALEHAPEWGSLSRNHLEGRTAAFFTYGDGGGDELDEDGRPRLLRHPDWFDPAERTCVEGREQYAPLVWQCRYSGVEVPDALWRHVDFGMGRKYGDNQAEHLMCEARALAEFDAWTAAFVGSVTSKGKVTPGRWRAFGYRPPSHRVADLRLYWRALRMAVGWPRPGTSPAVQHRFGLNRDATLTPRVGEGQRCRQEAASRKPDWGRTLLGILLTAQGLGKLLAPAGYFAALARFPLVPAGGDARIGAIWMVAEIGAGAGLAWSGMARAPRPATTIAAAMAALLIATAYLVLTGDAWLRGARLDNCTCFGVFLPQRLGTWVLLQDGYVLLWTALVLRGAIRAGRTGRTR